MSCTDIVCGTGGWSGPKPGDPDNNSVLSAVPAYGGVDLSWTYPATNSFAVSYVNIFRGLTDNPDLAVRRQRTSGDFYFDKEDSPGIQEYFYWIQFVSINGTYADWIGPVSCTPLASIDEVLTQLSGKINEGVLSQSLKDEFGKITLLKTELDAEIAARLSGNTAMADALSAVQSETAQALTLLSSEITQRTTADESLLDSVNVLAVGMGDNAAAIANEALARATDMSAVATQISTVQTTLNGQIAGVETTMGAAIQDMEQTKDKLNSLYTVKLTADGLAGGFGLVNDGSSVQAGFDVDTFWVGRTQADKLKPFIIDGDTVFLSNAVVPTIQSNNYEPGVSGWKIRKDGPAEFQDVIIRGGGTFSGELLAATGTFSGSINAASGYFGGIVDAASVMSALANSTNYSFSTPGNYVQPIPTGLTADTVRVRIIGGSGGGGGGGGSQKIMMGYSLITAMGGAGGKGGGGAIIDYTLPYSTLAGSTVTVTVGRGGAGGAGAVEGTFSAGSGQSGTSSSVSSVGSAVGGGGGGGGGEGYFTTGSADESVPVQGANGSTAGNGNGGLGGSAVEPSYTGYKGGTSGQAGTGGYVIISIYKGDVLVKNTSYQALISWLDSRGIGTVPAEAR